MKKVVIDYSRLTAPKMVARANTVHTALTGNANYPNLPVTLADLAAQIKKVSDADTAATNSDREALATLRDENKVLATMLRSNAEYVNTTTPGDEAKLLSSGYKLSKTPEKNVLPGAIAKIEAKFTDVSETISLIWSRSKHTNYFEVYMSADNGTTWSLLKIVLTRKMMVDALVTGKRYQFKVVPVGAAGKGTSSAVASQVAA